MKNLLDNQLKELLLPPENAGVSWMLVIGLSVLLCLFVFALWRWYQYKNTSAEIAKRKIMVLKRSMENEQKLSKNISLQRATQLLAKYLREGLEVTRLDEYRPYCRHQQSEWNNFQSKLDVACYSLEAQPETEVLINEALDWLRNVHGITSTL